MRHADEQKFLAASLGFSAGVMLYVSFVEILHRKSLGGFEDGGPQGDAGSGMVYLAGTSCLFWRYASHVGFEFRCSSFG